MYKITIEPMDGQAGERSVHEVDAFHLMAAKPGGAMESTDRFPNTPLLLTLFLVEIDRLKMKVFHPAPQGPPRILPATNVIPFKGPQN